MPLIALTIIFRSLAGIFAKQAALTSVDKGLIGFVLNIWLVAELLALVLQAVVWSFVLRRRPLSTAYPYLSLVFGLNLFAAWWLFGETITRNHILGMIIIVTGVVAMSLGQSGKGGSRAAGVA